MGGPGGVGGGDAASSGLGIGGMGLAGEAGIGGAAAGTGTGVAGGMGAAGTGAIGGGGGGEAAGTTVGTQMGPSDSNVNTAAATVAKQEPQAAETLAPIEPTPFETQVRGEMAKRRGGAPVSGAMGPMAPAAVRRRTLLSELGTGNAIATGAVIGELLGGNTGAVLGALTGAAAVNG